jgi:hypothetical protein
MDFNLRGINLKNGYMTVSTIIDFSLFELHLYVIRWWGTQNFEVLEYT